MSIFAETKCNFSPVSTQVYTALIHHITCRLEARQALIYQLVLGLTGENGKYNYSRAVHLYPPFFDISCSAKNYKIAPALTLTNARKTGTIQGLGPDGKAQVSVEYQKGKPKRIAAVVVSCQHDADKDLDELRREITRLVIVPALRELYPDHMTEVLINPSGRFVLGGFEADTGLTGRKLMVDTYGGLVPHGGGALSGKDATKVDRSGTYMARYIAKNIVAAGLAERCTVSLAYAIGRAEPVAVDVDLHETGRYPEAVLEQAVRDVFDLTPGGIIRTLGLDQPIYAPFCNYGHFTHQDAPWEQTDRTAALTEACGREDQGASHER